jgi:predicted PurR-regulated permease PerM
MSLPVSTQLRYWGIALAVFLFVLWWLGDVILPFVLGAAIAYMLDPLADRLERLGFSRAAATATITLFALLVFVLLLLVVVPTLIRQTSDLVAALPQIAQNLQSYLNERFPSMIEPDSAIRQSLSGLGETLQSRMGEVVNALISSVSGVMAALVLFVIVPVVAFYLLLDWDRMVARIDALLPREHAPTIRQLARDIDDTLASFIRGQGTVCLIVGIYYSVALMAVGLNFGLVVGAVAGILTFIPYVGALVGGALAIGLALFQFWGDWLWVVAVVVIFQLGQLVEGNFLTPKLVGDSVGLHPVWLIFALSAFGAVFGFVGMLVAVPVAAALGVLARFLTDRYKNSQLYRGPETPTPPTAPATSSAPSSPTTPDAP